MSSIKDLVYENCLKPLYPSTPNSNWSYSSEFKPGEEWCSIAELFASTKVQDELLESFLDVVVIPFDVKSKLRQGEYVYIRVDDEFVAKAQEFEALAKKLIGSKAHILTCFDGPFIKHFDEGDYVRWHTMESGCPIFRDDSFTFERALKEFQGYLTLNTNSHYSLGPYVGWLFSDNFNTYYKEKIEPFGQFFNDWFKEHDTFEILKDVCITACDVYQLAVKGGNKAREEAAAKKKAEEKAKFQSYCDWIEDGNPTYYRYGFSYKGAKVHRLDQSEAIRALKSKDYFEINWETINGEKSMVIQQYSDNDMY